MASPVVGAEIRGQRRLLLVLPEDTEAWRYSLKSWKNPHVAASSKGSVARWRSLSSHREEYVSHTSAGGEGNHRDTWRVTGFVAIRARGREVVFR
jgi:hypothetical protein